MKGAIALMAKQALFNLVIMAAVCSFQVNILSNVMPRNFVLLVLISIELDDVNLILSSFYFLVKNCKKCDLSKLNARRLLQNQLSNSCKTSLILYLKSRTFEFEIIILVSSASVISKSFYGSR